MCLLKRFLNNTDAFKVLNLRPRRMPFTFSGQSCEATWSAGVNGQHRNPSHVALQIPIRSKKKKRNFDEEDLHVKMSGGVKYFICTFVL